MRRARITLFFVCLVASCFPLRAAEEERVARLYPVRFLAPDRAMLEVQAAYPNSMQPGIEMRPQSFGDAGFLRVVAPAADQEAIARVLQEKDVSLPSMRLQFVLLDAMDASLPEPELPGGAAGALKDVRTLFPFKGYRVRNTAVLPASREANATMGSEFMLRVDARPISQATVEVKGLHLLGPGTMKGQTGFSELLGTSFTIQRGETVVLGTSLVPATTKVDPDVPRALVLLVTALP